MRNWAGVATVALVIALAFSAEGVGAQDTGQDAATLLRLAEQGDTRAAFLLGSRFARRGGVDDEVAVQWFRLAADGGLAEAQYNLGYMLANGRGLARDDVEAAAWFRRAAEQEFAQAQFNLASFYAAGRGLQKDEALAAAWFERAALQGLAPAQHNLGLLYEFGRGVPKDLDKARAWYERAAASGFDAARVRLSELRRESSRDTRPGATPRSATTASPRRAAPARPASAESSDAGWVGRQSPERYTLQLASFHTEDEARRMVETQLRGQEAGIYSALKRGRRWYSVVAGRYDSLAAARAAIPALPESIRRLKPWARRFGTIHREAGQP